MSLLDKAKNASATVSRNPCGIALLLVGVGILIHGMHGFARIPGDLIDARFNEYVLEHFWRLVTGREHDFWNAPIFYPYILTTAFSSNHLGSAPVYALFRLIGFDRDTAFQLWYLAGYAASFVAAYWVLLRAGMGKAAAAAGAFLFAFGLPALAQQNHAQLVWRCGVPLAAWWLWGFLREGKARLLFLAALATVWQLYSEIYMGVLLAMLLAAIVFAAGLLNPDGWRKAPQFWISRISGLWVGRSQRERAWLGGIAVLAVLAAALLAPYAEVVRHYGFVRDRAEVRLMLPQIRSYLLNDQSPLWSFVARRIDGLALRWEHQLFVGIGAAIAVAAAAIKPPPGPAQLYVRACRLALALLVIVTINFHNFSLYEALMGVPGVTAVRAVTRIIEVMLWPLAVLTAAILTHWLSRRGESKAGARWSAGAIALIVLIVGESALSLQYSVSKRFGQERVAALRAEIAAAQQPPSAPAIIAVATSSPAEFNVLDIDAMLAAQDVGLPTLNGYSGNTPPGYGAMSSCLSVIQHLQTYVATEKPAGPDPYGTLINRVLPIHFTDCPADWRTIRPTATWVDGPLDPSLFASLRLALRNVRVVGEAVEADVVITTTGDTLVPAAANAPNPLRLAWRLVDAKAQPSREGYDARAELVFDIQPGVDNLRHIRAALPKAGSYRLEASIVQENVGWLFDAGQPPARAADLILSTRN